MLGRATGRASSSRWRSANCMDTSWRRRVTKAARSCCSGSLSGRMKRSQSGRRANTPANSAKVAASIRSVLANRCIARGEVACHARIDHGHAQAGRLQRARQRRLVAAGGFHQHQFRLQARQPVGQRAMSVGIVADVTERCRKFATDGRHIDVRTAHVDTYHHG